jgi:hypothetical protein
MSKIARSDPCPCGSRKKYKDCCAAADAPGSFSQLDRARGAEPRPSRDLRLASNSTLVDLRLPLPRERQKPPFASAPPQRAASTASLTMSSAPTVE